MSAKKLFDTMGFGKHKDELIVEIIENDTEYVTWLIREVPSFELDNEAFERYKKVAEEKGLDI